MKRTLSLCCLALLLLASCQTKQSAIADLRSLTQELQINGSNYSINEWKDAGQRYYTINKRITKHTGDYSTEEVKEISELNGTCLRSFKEGAITTVKGAVGAVQSFLDGFLKK